MLQSVLCIQLNPSTLYACYNWWGSSSPNTSLFSIGSGSSFYYTPYLTSDPWAGIPKAGGNIQLGSAIQRENSSNFAKDNLTNTADSLLIGIELRLKKKNVDAKNFLVSYIARHPDNQRAYVELYNCYNKETANDIISFFNSLPTEASQDNKLLLSYLYLKQGDTDAATKVNDAIINENQNTSLSERAMMNNALIALYDENNVNKAVNIFKEVLKHPELSTDMELEDVSDAIANYASILGKKVVDFPSLRRSQAGNISIPQEYELFDNFPNPFNPTTIIRYGLPGDGFVTLKIYDILGREVATLVNEYKAAGTYNVTFNASNLSSGVYIYRLKSGDFVASKKLLLLK